MHLFSDASNVGTNIYDRWIQSRTLFLRQPISDEVANQLIAQLVYLDGEDSDPIQLCIHTEGCIAGWTCDFRHDSRLALSCSYGVWA